MMQKRFVSIWLPYLTADWLLIRRPELKDVPFVFAAPDHGRMLITSMSKIAARQGIEAGMRAADAKAMVPGVKVIDEKPGRAAKLLTGIGEWCIRYTPMVALDVPDGLLLDVSGCAHLWGGEEAYLKDITSRLASKGYMARVAMADTIGTAWAVSRYGSSESIVVSGEQKNSLLPLPPAALRLELDVLVRLQKLGFYQVSNFLYMPRSVLRRRFGEGLLKRLAQALGLEEEFLQPLHLPVAYQERLPCLESVRTATAIGIAITKLLEALCLRLQSDGKGIRSAVLKCICVDGRVEQVEIGTNQASHSVTHLGKLFELRIAFIRPGLGIELFILEATKTDEVPRVQEALWSAKPGLNNQSVVQLLDRIAGKIGAGAIRRYLPNAHYWPECSVKHTCSIEEKPVIEWRVDRPRPTKLLPRPELIEVTAPIPDYPPMLFLYKGQVHHIKRADGPERIEREWWLDEGEHRDYYSVEDEAGRRYWLFRSGHYSGMKPYQWFIHGFFA